MIRAAIIGIGWWGKTLVESVQGSSEVMRFTAACSRSRSNDHRAFTDAQDMKLYGDYAAVLQDPDVDAVVLATPPSAHHEQIIAAARAGKHVFTEKPFTMTRQEAVEVVDAAVSAGITLGLGYTRRFHPSWIDLRERVRAGELGTILHMESTMTGGNGLSMPASAWRAQRSEAPCGGLFPMAVHALDGMIDLCGEFDEAFTRSYRGVVENDVDDTTAALLHMRSGATATITTMMATAASSRFAVYGSRGWAQLLGTTHAAGQSSRERRMNVFGSYVFQPVKGERLDLDVPAFDVVAAELEAFAVACAGGADYPITHAEMIHGSALAEAIIRSAASGVPEKV
jgi:predicted dehydrogenase